MNRVGITYAHSFSTTSGMGDEVASQLLELAFRNQKYYVSLTVLPFYHTLRVSSDHWM